MKHYLNDLSNPNLWNMGRFDYALAIIKNIFILIKQIFLNPFFLFLSSLWLKDHNESKVIHLFCVILAILFFISDIAININIFLFVVNFSSFFSKSGYLIFCDELDLLFLWQNKTYLLIDTYNQIYGIFLLTGDFNAEDIQPCLSQFLFEYDTTNLNNGKTCFRSKRKPSCIHLFITNSSRVFKIYQQWQQGCLTFIKWLLQVIKLLS